VAGQSRGCWPPALLIVGHDPQLGWIADRLTGEPVPIDRGELVCLGYRAVPTSRLGRLLESAKPRTRRRSSHGWQLEWSIHPDDRKAVDAIQLKIKSKMESAKAMGAFATALVTFVLTQAHIYAPRVATVKGGLWAASTVLLIVAAALFFASLFQYDVLLMPIRFWASPAPSERSRRPGWVVSRPPSSSAWVLFQNMMGVFRRSSQRWVCRGSV
jgi:hypothetical protein